VWKYSHTAAAASAALATTARCHMLMFSTNAQQATIIVLVKNRGNATPV
jgi:hypothetical protein